MANLNPPAPNRYGARGPLICWLMRRRGKEWDRYTGSWVEAGWPATRQGFIEQHFANGEHVNGTCTLCGKSMALHPPERVWTADPAMCPR